MSPRREQLAVPPAEFQSYYGRAILKSPVWDWRIAAYLFTGGLSASSALLGAGADLTGRRGLRRVSRLGSMVGILVSLVFLVADLGRPERFHHMLRVAKPSSPMSVGTWILTAYGPFTVLAGVAELMPKALRRSWIGRLIDWAARPAGVTAAAVAPAVASYTAVLLSQTAVPAWRESYRHLPFMFTGSAAGAGAGLGLLLAPVDQTGPARRLAAVGVTLEVGAARLLEHQLGITREAFLTGTPHRLLKWSEIVTVGGAIGAQLPGRRRWVAAVSGAALLTGSALQRLGVFYAGVESTRDPKYVVVPQRERLDAGTPARGDDRTGPRFSALTAAVQRARATMVHAAHR